MTVAIIGAGFTGLSAGLELVRRRQDVVIFESSDRVGGLAVGFREENWEWTAERFYHHIFTNDLAIIRLSTDLGIPPLFLRPVTAVLWNGRMYPFDSPIELLRFPGLSLAEKLRMGAVLAGFKALPNGRMLEGWPAAPALKLLMGTRGFGTIWEPLLTGKFERFAPQVNLAWFWARIKKRTPRLGTFPGGFQALADRMAEEIRQRGGTIELNQKVSIDDATRRFDVVLSTLPEKNGQTHYLDAHILFLELSRPFLDHVYWLNILDRSFPFLVVGEHTNFVDSKYFGGARLVYVGNYLPSSHSLFNLNVDEVIAQFLPWMRKINPQFSKKWIQKAHVFRGPFAQPVMTVNYSKTIPPIRRSNNFYCANQAMIYPWDRGTNYAVELGQRAARMIVNSNRKSQMSKLHLKS